MNEYPQKSNKTSILMKRIRDLVYSNAFHIIPKDKEFGCGGTGGPGKLLEMKVGSDGKNKRDADFKGIEIKYKSINEDGKKSCLMTLFHADPKGKLDGMPSNKKIRSSDYLRPLLDRFGYRDKEGRLAFRHTIAGSSGFVVKHKDNQILVTHPDSGVIIPWNCDRLLSSASKKLEQIVLVTGLLNVRDGDRYVKFVRAEHLEDFKASSFMECIVNGDVVIDFDFREMEIGSFGLRNHGTKFRISAENLGKLWSKTTIIANAPF